MHKRKGRRDSQRLPSPAFQTLSSQPQPWRILYLGEDFAAETGGTVPIWVAVGEPWSDRNSVINRMLWQSSLPLAGIVLLLAIVLYTGVGRALQPLQRLRNQIARRSPKSLKPMRAEQAPMELKPVIDAINDLLRKLDVALEREKQFTADAAHELRTPLGALKAQAQVALRESDAERRSVALQNLVLGVERATHLVNQLLTIARLDPGRTELRDSSFALVPGLEEVLADLAPEAQERGVELRLERACDGVAVKGDKVLIQTMLRNIVHNAIVYAPEKVGAVTVHARLVENGCRISVIDNGPGIPKTERERVFDRFYRIPGNSSFGAGLGLSIASRVAGLHETELRIEENPAGTGLCVSVQLQIDGDADAVPRMRPGNRRRVA